MAEAGHSHVRSGGAESSLRAMRGARFEDFGDKAVGVVKCALGASLLRLRPRKSIVLIASSRRAGSTLLKALLAEAPDISNLPEFNYNAYWRYPAWRFYFDAYRLAPERILVLKDPAHWADPIYPYVPPIHGTKVLVLIRNPVETVRSLARRRRELLESAGKQAPVDLEEKLLDYWCWVYEQIEHAIAYKGVLSRVVKYEDLVREPAEVTRRLYEFVGSCRNNGAETYSRPRGFEWEWGRDDGGARIRSLRVQAPGEAADELLMAKVRASTRCERLRQAFGYDSEWR